MTPAASSTAVDRPPLLRVARRVLLIALLVSVAVLLLLALQLLFDASFGRPEETTGSAIVTGFWSLVGFAVLRAIDASSRRDARWFVGVAWGAAVASTIAAAAWLLLIWLPFGPANTPIGRLAGIATVWSVESLIPLAFISPTPLPRWARLVALACGTFLGWLGILATGAILELGWVEQLVKSVGEETFFRLHAAGAIFAFCGLVVAAVVQRFLSRGEPERGRTIPWRLDVALTCPRCGLAQTLPVGATGESSRCGRCRLKIMVEVDEPRCRCGYVLYKLAGDACPECGSPVADEDRWLSRGREGGEGKDPSAAARERSEGSLPPGEGDSAGEPARGEATRRQ